jgi:hypothetical protein
MSRKDTQAGSGDLESERQTVESSADLDHRAGVGVVEAEASAHGADPVQEERHRWRRLDLALARRRRWDRQREHGPDVLAPDAQALAARGHDRDLRAAAGQRLHQARGGVEDVFAVVHHEQHPAGPQGVHQRIREVAPGGQGYSQRVCDRMGHSLR